jgi:radical SAM superfamily enzyme YgiQ (UPF0313 family)
MKDIIITADESCVLNHQLSFLAGFLACVPRDRIPKLLRVYVEKKLFAQPEDYNGIAKLATLPLRRIEGILLKNGFDTQICTPRTIEQFKAKVFAVSTMDPFGVGPASSAMTGLTDSKEPYNKYYFEKLIKRIRTSNPNAKIIVGGPGAWQFEALPEEMKHLGIDCIVMGELENIAKEVFNSALKNQLPKKFIGTQAEEIPLIRGPCYWGLTEISRGCDRMCQFCDPTMRKFRWFSYEQIAKEAEINTQSPDIDQITLLSEDVLRYGTKLGEWIPNEKLVKLIKMVNNIAKAKGKKVSFTHASLAAAASAPKIIREISEELELGGKNLSAFQVGLETGSVKLIETYMRNKAKPWEPKDWWEVAEKGFSVLTENNIIPCATLILGLEKETEDDVIKTIELVEHLHSYPSLIMPLFFVPLGILKEKRAFDKSKLTEPQKDLLIACGKHTSYWARNFINWSGGLSSIDRFVLQVGSMIMLESLKALKKETQAITKLELVELFIKETEKYAFDRTLEYPQKIMEGVNYGFSKISK